MKSCKAARVSMWHQTLGVDNKLLTGVKTT